MTKKQIPLDYNPRHVIEVIFDKGSDEHDYPFYFYVGFGHQASTRMTREQMAQLRDSINELLEQP